MADPTRYAALAENLDRWSKTTTLWGHTHFTLYDSSRRIVSCHARLNELADALVAALEGEG